ncbi:hypothetical protein Tco_1492482 [Tanacetum coccineum]
MQTTHVAKEAATMPHDSPLLRVHSLGSDEGSMTLNELMVLCTTLSKKVETLESDLKQTKLTYGAAYTKLIMKVKKLEHKVKSSKARRRVRLVVSEDEDELEDPSKQGRKIAQIDEDEGITLFIAPEEDYTVEPDISTANVPVNTAEPDIRTPSPEKKTKLQLEQERLRLEEALRLQEQLDEEERQRIARVHEVASILMLKNSLYMKEENIAHKELKQRRNTAHDSSQQRTYMCNYIKNIGSHTLQQLKKLSFDEVKELFETTMKRVNTFTPMKSNDTVPKVVAGSSKIDAEQELNQESSKRQKIGEDLEPAEE